MLLAIAGMIPVLGIAANAYNAYLYFEEGDILNGILCTAGAIVGVGGFMSTVGMAAKACTLIQAGQYVKAAGLAYTTAAMAYMTVDNAYQTYNLLVENDFTFTEEVQLSIGNTFLAGIGTVAGFKGFINCMNETAAMIQKAEASCFVAGTQVLTREGFKNIEDIQPGDYVYSTSDETGESGYKEVLEVFAKETEVITHVFYATKDNDGQESEIHAIETTLNHRFWSEGEWKSAGTLKAGDLLTLADGTQVEVTDVTFEDRHETVYNMEVADYHTYYVGEDGVWVHNRYGQQGGTAGKGRKNNNDALSSQIEGTSYDINKLQKTQSYIDSDTVSSIKEAIAQNGPNAVPPIEVRVHNGQALVVDGHHRLEAFYQLGYDRVPIRYLHNSQLGKILSDGTYYRPLQELLDAIELLK